MGTRAAFIAGSTSFALLVLAGCSATPEALETKSDIVSRNFSDKYEEIYRRVSGTARRCVTGSSGNLITSARLEVEADLHKELGSADVRFVVNGLFSNYFLSAKIEKMGSGSRVSVKVNNPMIGDKLGQMVFRWAGGDQQC